YQPEPAFGIGAGIKAKAWLLQGKLVLRQWGEVNGALDALARDLVDNAPGHDNSPPQLNVGVDGFQARRAGHINRAANQGHVPRRRYFNANLPHLADARKLIVSLGIRESCAAEYPDRGPDNRLVRVRLAHRSLDDPSRLDDVFERGTKQVGHAPTVAVA